MKIAIIGCGGLGTSLALGLLRSKDRELELRLCDHNREKVDGIANEFLSREIMCTTSPREATEGAEVVIIAVKPKDIFRSIAQIREDLRSETLLVSCAAGITLASLDKAAAKRTAIARAMPNTAVSVAAGTIGLFLGPHCDVQRDEGRLARIFGVLGDVKTMSHEDAMHCVAALSGSGPAFVLVVLEAMIDAGVRSGLPRSEAEFFAKGALKGAAALVEHSVLPSHDLRAQITSPAGMTAEGLYKLEKGGLRATMMDAIDAATRRSEELTAVTENN